MHDITGNIYMHLQMRIYYTHVILGLIITQILPKILIAAISYV